MFKKKIILILCSSILILGLFIGGILIINNFTKINKSFKLLTYDDVLLKEIDGELSNYNEINSKLEELDSLDVSLKYYTDKVNQNYNIIEKLNSDTDINNSIIVDLENDKSNLQSSIELETNNKISNEILLDNLELSKPGLDNEYLQSEEDLNNLNLNIENLTMQFEDLKSEYENLSKSYLVAFVNGSSILSSEIIEENNFVQAPTNPTSTNTTFKFKGWSLDKLNIVDVSSYSISENTVFYAVFDDVYSVENSTGKVIEFWGAKFTSSRFYNSSIKINTTNWNLPYTYTPSYNDYIGGIYNLDSSYEKYYFAGYSNKYSRLSSPIDYKIVYSFEELEKYDIQETFVLNNRYYNFPYPVFVQVATVNFFDCNNGNRISKIWSNSDFEYLDYNELYNNSPIDSKFLGWSTTKNSDKNIKDLSSYNVQSLVSNRYSINLYPIFEINIGVFDFSHIYTAPNYSSHSSINGLGRGNEPVRLSYNVIYGGSFDLPNLPGNKFCNFVGYGNSLNEETLEYNLIDTFNYVYGSDRTLYAVYTPVYKVDLVYYYDDSDLSKFNTYTTYIEKGGIFDINSLCDNVPVEISSATWYLGTWSFTGSQGVATYRFEYVNEFDIMTPFEVNKHLIFSNKQSQSYTNPEIPGGSLT